MRATTKAVFGGFLSGVLLTGCTTGSVRVGSRAFDDQRLAAFQSAAIDGSGSACLCGPQCTCENAISDMNEATEAVTTAPRANTKDTEPAGNTEEVANVVETKSNDEPNQTIVLAKTKTVADQTNPVEQESNLPVDPATGVTNSKDAEIESLKAKVAELEAELQTKSADADPEWQMARQTGNAIAITEIETTSVDSPQPKPVPVAISEHETASDSDNITATEPEGPSNVTVSSGEVTTVVKQSAVIEDALSQEIRLLKNEQETIQSLSHEVEPKLNNRPERSSAAIAGQMEELKGILKNLAAKKEVSTPVTSTKPGSVSAISTDESVKPNVDAVGEKATIEMAKGLFRAGNYEAAEKAFRVIEASTSTAAEKLPLRYMIATCLRKQGKLAAAAKIYEEVLKSDRDDVLKDYARWQLESINWRLTAQKRVEQLSASSLK